MSEPASEPLPSSPGRAGVGDRSAAGGGGGASPAQSANYIMGTKRRISLGLV